ncbi:cytosol aminopeptidase family, catalytic domain protein [Necator americanus]|uniref:Cytosol aminopeptidase family, catalytic domain protein n=1 Tax=Necator americanus TaxID=51031 RepID=W2T629_NECAM|nr:cytosol aminopeptidase family, catalytic domain protein [Necator americanus]ETN77079.1 cytosol aminopeptidase family, catalytic domain protein [Necator americanus]
MIEVFKIFINRALSAGIKSPLLVTVPHPRHPQAELVSALGALLPLYTPLNVREEEPTNKFDQLGLLPIRFERLVDLVEAYEAAFTVCRDVGETGPERMSPPNTAEYVKSAFLGGNVKVEVTEDQKLIEKEYPLMAAVNRCANTVKEHQARLVRLEYVGEGDIKDTYMMVGKGVTIDTGGCDLKTGGNMWGMCRDKYGSAVVAGFFKVLDILKPKHVKALLHFELTITTNTFCEGLATPSSRAIGYMCMVRNSIGAKAYTCDEVIKSRSGKRIHIYNTDAEGRITMLDPLTRAKEEALNEVNPHLMTLATLTGHEVLTYGYYAAIMDNGPAKKSGWARKIQDTGDTYGQPIEISRLQPEDYEFHKAECEQAHIRQGNTKPSTVTLRGHQTPAAFLIMASRLDEHGCDSKHPLKFTHIDIGSAAGEHPDTSLPNPLVTLVAE